VSTWLDIAGQHLLHVPRRTNDFLSGQRILSKGKTSQTSQTSKTNKTSKISKTIEISMTSKTVKRLETSQTSKTSEASKTILKELCSGYPIPNLRLKESEKN
jgi:hypothetical protein